MLYTDRPKIHLDSFNLSFGLKISFILNPILKVEGKTKVIFFMKTIYCLRNGVNKMRFWIRGAVDSTQHSLGLLGDI